MSSQPENIEILQISSNPPHQRFNVRERSMSYILFQKLPQRLVVDDNFIQKIRFIDAHSGTLCAASHDLLHLFRPEIHQNGHCQIAQTLPSIDRLLHFQLHSVPKEELLNHRDSVGAIEPALGHQHPAELPLADPAPIDIVPQMRPHRLLLLRQRRPLQTECAEPRSQRPSALAVVPMDSVVIFELHHLGTVQLDGISLDFGNELVHGPPTVDTQDVPEEIGQLIVGVWHYGTCKVVVVNGAAMNSAGCAMVRLYSGFSVKKRVQKLVLSDSEGKYFEIS